MGQVRQEVLVTMRSQRPKMQVPEVGQGTGSAKFKVQVPKPYPGVQYRKSKDLADKYDRYAKHGSTVIGAVEDGGEWLRVRDSLYLPMRLGTVQILQQVENTGKTTNDAGDGSSSPRWWPCGTNVQNEAKPQFNSAEDGNDDVNMAPMPEPPAVKRVAGP